MKRFVAPILIVCAVLFVPGIASARGDGWQFLPAQSFTTHSCGTTVRDAIVANKEYAKIVANPDGSIVFELVTGVLKVRLTNKATGRSFLVNASGTGHDAVLYPNGDFLFQSSGPALITLTPEQAAETGLPEIFLNKGNMLLLFHADGSAELLSRTGRLVDECARLTA
jgi:hypothetical protein